VSAEIDGRANPQSAVLWKFEAEDVDRDGKVDIEETIHRTIGSPAISNGLVILADFAGVVHCLDARTGRHYWSHDMIARASGSPLIAGRHVYVGDEDGKITVFELSPQKQIVAENSLPSSVLGAPAAANGTLYILTQNFLFAIAKPSP
jgi:outer membrane protein assembly factor BamB